MDFCCACGQNATRKRFFDTKSGKRNEMNLIYNKITGIEVTENFKFLCRSCSDKMFTMNENIERFKLMCENTINARSSVVNASVPIFATTATSFTPIQSHKFSTAISCYVPNATGDNPSNIVDGQLSDIEHNYGKSDPTTTHTKRQKTVVSTIPTLPPLSDHDHTYHTGAVKDMHIFQYPTIIREYFEDDDNSKSFFTMDEIKTLTILLQKGDIFTFINYLLTNDKVTKCIIKVLSKEYKKTTSGMANTKNGFVSILMRKSLKDLEHIQWGFIGDEFRSKFKIMFDLMCAIMLPDVETPKQLDEILPRLCLIYSIFLQARHPTLSLMQRLNSMLLMDHICDQKVYDRFQVLGITLSYQKSLHVLDLLGGSFNTAVIEALRSKKTIRIIGDNVNWKTAIKNQHASHEGKTFEMHHAFASAFLINDFKLENLPVPLDTTTPQRAWQEIRPKDFMLSENEIVGKKAAYTHIICKVISRFIPSLSFMGDNMPQYLKGEHTKFMTEKTKVIPLETLPCNEQKYDEVVQILEYYEKSLEDLHKQAGTTLKDDDCFHIGGDLLTRERFSGSKRLRANERNVSDRFDHLRPITFELFHLLMNFLQAFNHFLYNKNSSKEIGTMFSELKRIKRTNFDPEVSAAYDADKDFIVSFIDVHIIELVLEYFGMESIHSKPTKHHPPEFLDDDERKKWTLSTIGDLLEKNMFKHVKGCTDFESEESDQIIEDATVLTCTLGNGKMVEIKIPKQETKLKKKTDGVQNYAFLVLSLGLVFKDLLDVCKVPDRKRLIRIMKDCIIIFKAKSNLSKYALDIVRFLMQQTVVLSEEQATKSLYSMFVNTKGKLDSHIPADLQMEYLVKLTKKHIKHMFSNKSMQNISKKTRSLASIQSVCDNFDNVSDVKVRCKKHAHPTYMDDELMMLEDLRSIRPFQNLPGREHSSFKNIKNSPSDYLDGAHFHEWLMRRIKTDATDLGI